MFERILLPVDGSEPSLRAARLVASLAQKTGAEVIVMHVKEHEDLYGGRVDFETDREANELVDGIVRDLKDAGVSARGELVPAFLGRAPREILEMASETGADIIVMGSRGLSDFAGLVMGSVTHKVLHLAHCPVLVVR